MTQRHQVRRAPSLQHDGRAAHQVEAVVPARVQDLIEQVLAHEPHRVARLIPSLGGLVGQDVMRLEPIRVLRRPPVERGAAEQVALDPRAKDERYLGVVAGISKYLGGDLHDGGDPGAAGYHVEVRGVALLVLLEELAVAVVVELADRPPHVHGLTDLE